MVKSFARSILIDMNNPTSAHTSLSLLVVDDDYLMQRVAITMLNALGYSGVVVEDGSKARACMAQRSFDVVLMDVMMPVMDGLAATRAILALPGAAGQVKVIGLTANASRDDEAACRAAGMDGFAPKPIAPERLTGEIARVCEGAAGCPAGAPAGTAPATIDPSALAALDAALGAGAAAEIAAAFLADAPARLDRMRALAASGAADKLAREAHALAGSAGTLGLWALASAARSLEKGSLETGAAGAVADLPARLAPLEALADDAVAWLTPQAAPSGAG